MSAEIAYGLRMLREDAVHFEKLGLPDLAARARAAADKIEALAKADEHQPSRPIFGQRPDGQPWGTPP